MGINVKSKYLCSLCHLCALIRTSRILSIKDWDRIFLIFSCRRRFSIHEDVALLGDFRLFTTQEIIVEIF